MRLYSLRVLPFRQHASNAASNTSSTSGSHASGADTATSDAQAPKEGLPANAFAPGPGMFRCHCYSGGTSETS